MKAGDWAKVLVAAGVAGAIGAMGSAFVVRSEIDDISAATFELHRRLDEMAKRIDRLQDEESPRIRPLSQARRGGFAPLRHSH
jgi:hypothetical protein